ncbi:MAG: DUF1080 domain-containing protein [Pirellulales bacterium]|nr:DUF1080 domain-containing protein [Pirellulales bacterium]
MKRTVCSFRLPVFVVLVCAMGAPAAAAGPPDGQRDLLTTESDSGELPGWKAFSEEPDTKTGEVWKLSDGVLVCKGTPKGYLYTEEAYRDFVLRLEWRWPPDKKAGNGGVLVRTTGKNKIWPKSLEAQINAGDAGDFWGLDGYRLDGPADRLTSLEHPQFGKLTNLKKIRAAEKPAGQWNQYEIIADGPTVTLVINGQVVNKATRCEPVPGRICLTAEGDEIHFRNVRLTPVKSAARSVFY